MKTIFSTGTLLVVGGLFLNAVAAEPLVKDQQLDRLSSSTEKYILQDSKQPDRIAHKKPVNATNVSSDTEQSIDDDCE